VALGVGGDLGDVDGLVVDLQVVVEDAGVAALEHLGQVLV
jgi:hypothetical protein